MEISNRAWVLVSRPKDYFENENVRMMELKVPELATGEFLVKNIWLSFDPTQLNWMKRDTYVDKIEIGEVVRSFSVGQIVESKNNQFKVGDFVSGLFGWQEYAISDGSFVDRVRPIEFVNPPWYSLSLFGITGMSAYFGVKDIGKVKKGDNFLVSSAAGSVGSVAGQIAKIIGAKVIGIAGGEKKCKWVVAEAGFDYCIDYQKENISEKLSELFPEGIDVYFDNVGGQILDIVLSKIRQNGRIVLCGAISGYGTENFYTLRNYPILISRRARMEGFIVTDFIERFGEAYRDLYIWLKENRLKQREEITFGLENAPDVFKKLFTGANFGKQILKIADI
jgi:NADPH-dependent curcumin reductase CurA